MKLLFLCSELPLSNRPVALRSFYLIREFLARGADITVLHRSTVNSHLENFLRTEFPDRSIVIRSFSHRILIDYEFAKFVMYSLWVFPVLANKYDLVFATSSKLGTGLLGLIIAYLRRSFLIIDLRDSLSDSFNILANPLSSILSKFIWYIEAVVVSKSDYFTVVSPGQFEFYKDRGFAPSAMVPNFISDEVFAALYSDIENNQICDTNSVTLNNNLALMRKLKSQYKSTVLYTGNIGMAQDFNTFISLLQTQKGFNEIALIICGSGRCYASVSEQIGSLNNVILLPEVDRVSVDSLVALADFLLVRLGNFQSNHRVIPSKFMSFINTSKPIIFSGPYTSFRDYFGENGIFYFSDDDIEGLIELVIDSIEKIPLDVEKRNLTAGSLGAANLASQYVGGVINEYERRVSCNQ